ncbi:SLC13 family permease [Streptomyces sp. NBC_01497]|uniref:SLC13 family permease n=1 Tax=Streptomyces sp. NBC_01497 TaxID=2903885 RepID=UPI002E33BC7F|nr:SLC13 family permease [Streptomyces sp. NBC_01497]
MEPALNTVTAEIVSVALLLGVLAFAVIRPAKLPEAVAAVPAAGLLIALGAVSPGEAWHQIRELLPVVAFLAAVLVLSELCAADGLFEAAGDLVARLCGGRPGRLLGGVFVVAALTTAVLSLDATVVLLTPVVFATTARVGARARPHVYASAHLANSASLLLPVSNLTNLLALSASGLSFTRFATLMVLPWLAAIAAEYVVFRRWFAADLAAGGHPPRAAERRPLPLFTTVVLLLTLVGFAATSLIGLQPVWAALGGALVLAVRALARGGRMPAAGGDTAGGDTASGTGPVAPRTDEAGDTKDGAGDTDRAVGGTAPAAGGGPARITPLGIVMSASPLFCLFVLALGVVVKAVVDNGLGSGIGAILPGGSSLGALLAVAGIAAVLANVINNLPAVLALLPVVAPAGPGPVLAALIGVNLGPNLTYVGSLATLLWRRILHEHGAEPTLGHFTRLGLITVPATLLVATVALWGALAVVGG